MWERVIDGDLIVADGRSARPGGASGERVEQAPQHLVRRSDHGRSGLSQQIRLTQIDQRSDQISIVGIRDLRRVLTQLLAAGRDRGQSAADGARKERGRGNSGNGTHRSGIGSARANLSLI